MEWLITNIDLPAIAFFLIFGAFVYVLWQAQHTPDNNFDVKDMLRDANGKPSAFRLFSFICAAATTWALMYHTIKTTGQINEWIFALYLAVWSGSAVASKIVDAYQSRNGGTPVGAQPEKDPE